MNLKMEIYTPNLELGGILEVYNSVIWKSKSFSSGSFSLNAQITEESRRLLVPDNIIWFEEGSAGIIECINQQETEAGEYIVVKGCDLTGILGRRILWGQYSLNGDAAALMRYLVTDCCIEPTRGAVEDRKIPNLVLAEEQPESVKIRTQITGGTLLAALEKLGETYGISFGVSFQPQVPQMEFWARPGKNLTTGQKINAPVFFSTELDDIQSSEYSYNSQNYRNIALVAGEGEGNERVYVTIDGDEPGQPIPPTPPKPDQYTITLRAEPQEGGKVAGGGRYKEGEQITITASSNDGYAFSAWQENGEDVSTDESYTFIVNRSRTLAALFASVPSAPEWKAATLPSSAVWIDSAYGNGRFVIVAQGSNKAAYSTDGINWEAAALPSSRRWQGLAYGNSLFVTVAGGSTSTNASAYSTDGINWEASTLPSNGYWTDVAYGNGMFVAIAGNNTSKAAYSTDGITWKESALPANAYWQNVAYCNGLFIAMIANARNAIRIACSKNGIDWEWLPMPSSATWYSAAYGNGRFVIAARNSNKAAYSTDGTNWEESTLPATDAWNAVAYGNGKFVAVGYGGEIAAYSMDGITWEPSALPATKDWQTIAYGNGKFVAVAANSDAAAYSLG